MTTSTDGARLGIFTVGMGAVASTFVAGVEKIRRQGLPAIGSYTQLAQLTLPDGRRLRVAEALGLVDLKQLVFGGVDLIEPDAYRAAATAGVLTPQDLAEARPFLSTINVGPGLHDPNYVRTLPAMRTRPETSKLAQAEAMTEEYKTFFASNDCARGVVLLTLSTEAWRPILPVHASITSFLAGLAQNDPDISPSQIYAWAAIQAGFPVVNCTPNPVLEVPAIQALALERGVPIAGSDLKSGQTLLKTVVAGGLARRYLGVRGWYSTNILGNRDGFVLHEPENFRSKEITKSGVLADIFDATAQPELYGDLVHQVHINYFPPKGDNKEAWDSVQINGWLGYEMELKINFQCRDSILAAPLVLDLALLADLSARRGAKGIQAWLGGFFKSPAHPQGETPENDFPRQIETLERHLQAWC